MAHINYAEHDKQLELAPTLAQCERLGGTHKAYGWSRSPWGNWTEEQKDAYSRGYNRQSYPWDSNDS